MNSIATSMGEVKHLLNHTIDNNFIIEEKHIRQPIAICLEADAGIGKTSIVEQVAKERGMGFTKVSLHELDEAGDLCGWPQQEYECQVAQIIKKQDGTTERKILPGTVWLNAKQLDTPNKGTAIRQTGRTRMSYAKPAWVPEYNENGNIFLLDDFGRCNQSLRQAVMELILTGGYISWKLPKKTTIVLTSNPDNGEYDVASQDPALRSRYMAYEISFDLAAWEKWAEGADVDGRCINFVDSYHNELFNADDEGNRICNPRSFVMFSDMISNIKDWDNPENLSFIQLIARGCFKDEGGKFASMFGSFIRNKMHQLVQPKDILLKKWDEIRPVLEDTLYDGSSYRSDIASLLERRFTNYVGAWLSSDGKTPIATVKDRIIDIIEAKDKTGKKIFTQDMIFHMIKEITSDHKNQTNKLLFEPKIAKILS